MPSNKFTIWNSLVVRTENNSNNLQEKRVLRSLGSFFFFKLPIALYFILFYFLGSF